MPESDEEAPVAGGIQAPVTPYELSMKTVNSVGGRMAVSHTIHKLRHAIYRIRDQAKAQESMLGNAKAKGLHVTPEQVKEHLEKDWAKKNPNPSLLKAMQASVTPTIQGVVGNSALSFIRPVFDKKFRSGERGYIDSWLRLQRENAADIGRKSEEAKERYGPILAAPVQALHGLLNPISSLTYGVGALNDYFTGKQAALNIRRAEAAVRNALGG